MVGGAISVVNPIRRTYKKMRFLNQKIERKIRRNRNKEENFTDENSAAATRRERFGWGGERKLNAQRGSLPNNSTSTRNR